MKAEVYYDNKIQRIKGDLTFNKTLNLYKISNDHRNVYVPESSIDYIVELPGNTTRRTTSRRKK